jgi:hypothetical protein
MIASEHGQSVSIAACDNALGQAIPPMVLCKGKRCQPEGSNDTPNIKYIKKNQSKSGCSNVIRKEENSFQDPDRVPRSTDDEKGTAPFV